uniref:FKBP_N_2 domain-containing protein n=1 Tax=Anopheles epiroticus TaxID=199890 RepID=A0A182P2G3_9DIPT
MAVTMWYYIGRLFDSERKFQNGELIVLTGANSGIGLATLFELADRGCHLVIGTRCPAVGQTIRDKVLQQRPCATIDTFVLKLESLASVVEFSENVRNLNKPLYALVNNAGVFYVPPSLTEDELEYLYQVNYLAHYLLTLRLLPALKQHPSDSRIVNVVSQAHRSVTEIPADDSFCGSLYHDTASNRFRAYAYSKFCLVQFSYRLSQLLATTCNVSVHCIDPGNVETAIYRHFPPLANRVLFYLQKPLRIFLIKTPHEGAQGVLYSVLSHKKPPFYIRHFWAEPETVQSPSAGDDCLVPPVYEDPSKGLRKERLSFRFTSAEKPSELSRCLVTISDVSNVEAHETSYLIDTSTEERWITMGTALTPVDCYVELLLQQMLTNEESKCTISCTKTNSISFTMKLLRIEGQKYFYELTVPETLTLAKQYKENGVKMFPKYPTFAHTYFNLAAKCLLSWSPIDQLDASIEGATTVEEMKSLLETLQLNIAACLLKQNRYDEVLHVLRYTDGQENPSPKATYRKALAQFKVKRFEEAIATLERIDYANSKECATLYKQIIATRQQEDSKYSLMVKKMFA